MLHVEQSSVRDIIVNLARIGTASKFSGTIEAFFEEYLVTETGLKTVPFAGRDDDLKLLDAWLDDGTMSPRYLLTAPAGRGKSALLVRWLQQLQDQNRVGEDLPSSSWHLVFVPISIRFETHRPDIFYEAIAARLVEIVGGELQPTQTDKAVYYADHCRTLANAAIAKHQRILIVLDGIDEALGERFDVRWFPRNPGTNLRLLLSSRWLAGDVDSSGWKTRLGWGRDVRVQCRELPVLTQDGVRDLLNTMGTPTDVLASRPDIVNRLHELAEGEPLILRYYAEDIWGMRAAAPRLTIDDLAHMRPGFGGYFERWFGDQERLWKESEASVDRGRVEAILAILACAHGRLKGADLRAVLTECGNAAAVGRFIDLLKPIQRFVIGLDRSETETAGYILSHPKLGIYLRDEYFDPDYIKATQAAFVHWGHKTVEQLNSDALRPKDAPAYLLQYHTQHLQDAAAPTDYFLELVEHGWLGAWKTFEGGYRGFSRDVRQTYEVLSTVDATAGSNLAQRLRCQLALSSIHSIGARTPWELLVAAFKAGVLTFGEVSHWLEFRSSNDRARALGELAPRLPAELFPEALTLARSIEDSGDRARALGELAPRLPEDQIRQSVEELLSVIPKCQRYSSLQVVSLFFPFLRSSEGPKGLEELRRAIIDTARWFP